MDGILKRIKEIIEKEGISPSELADSIGIGRPLLSHVLSGRNNPSLQVVLKILEHYPAYSANWLLTGNADLAQTEAKPERSVLNFSEDLPVNKPLISMQTVQEQPKKKTLDELPELVLMMFDDKTYEAYKLRK